MVLQRPLHHYDAATAITMEKLLRVRGPQLGFKNA